jgi:tRNA1Val (adenine37-N6)-methyltransferase
MRALTHDSISLRGAGVVQITQPAKGHRFTLDSILLADFCRIKPSDRVLEPGAGTGAISLLLAKKHPRSSFTAIEIQSSLIGLFEQNISANSLKGRITVLAQDLRKLKGVLAPGSFHAIVANPPYAKEGTGRISPLAARQTARHDRAASLEAWLDLQSFLRNKGRYCMVFPASRMAELVSLMRARTLEPKRLRLVHSHQEKPASLVLVEAVKAGGTGLEVLLPLIVHNSGGGYTEEVKQIYGQLLISLTPHRFEYLKSL